MWKHQHITSILVSLHWFPMSYKIKFKTLLLTFKWQNNKAHLSELLNNIPYHLPCNNILHLFTPKTKLPSTGSRSLSLERSSWPPEGSSNIFFLLFIVIITVTFAEMFTGDCHVVSWWHLVQAVICCHYQLWQPCALYWYGSYRHRHLQTST